MSVTQSFLRRFRTRWFIFFSDGEGAKNFSYANNFFFLLILHAMHLTGSLHGHCNNLIKVFHHYINVHNTFSCLLFQIFNTEIHSIAFAQNTFFFQVKMGQLPVFLLSALSYCSAQWAVQNSSEFVTTPYSLLLVPYPTVVLTKQKWKQNVFGVKDGPFHFFFIKWGGGDFENKTARARAGKQISCRAQTYINPL